MEKIKKMLKLKYGLITHLIILKLTWNKKIMKGTMNM